MGVVFSSLISQSKGQDRLSALPDVVLLCILGRVGDLRTAVRTSVLSTRWRRLPWLLPELNIDVKDFISVPQHGSVETSIIPDPKVIHDTMLTITAATKSLFAKPRRESSVARLQLSLYLIDTFSCDIAPLVCEAIDRGLLKDLGLAILDDKEPFTWPDTDVLRRAHDMDGFFRAYPSFRHCLTRLSLCSLDFLQLDMHHILFDCCTQLKHLSLFFCQAGRTGPWKVDAPNSKLCVLELVGCCFETVELISLPKLEKVKRHGWRSNYLPCSFGFVPSLEELDLKHFWDNYQSFVKLSEILHGAADIRTITLDFMGDTIWLQPEIKQLATAFPKLRKLSLLGVFVEFDLLWTIAFLEAAPSVEILHIEVYEPCELEHVHSSCPAHNRTSPQWDLDYHSSKNLVLRELHVDCFKPLEQQVTFIRAVLERAPNVQVVVLRKDDEECDECAAMANGPPSVSSAQPPFPKNKEEQDMMVRRVTDGISFSGRVIFQ